MSGRHGKLSGSPFHVVTIKDIAKERYDSTYKSPQIECSYRKNGICTLPQNKKDYNSSCATYRCKFLQPIRQQTRNDCAFAVNNSCIRNKNLRNCSNKHDLAFCCDYFISKTKNPEFAERVLQSFLFDEALSLYQYLLKSKQKKEKLLRKKIDNEKREEVQVRLLEVCDKIERTKATLLSFPIKRSKDKEYLANKVSTELGFFKTEVQYLHSHGVYSLGDFINLDESLFLTFVNSKGKSFAPHLTEIKETIILFRAL